MYILQSTYTDRVSRKLWDVTERQADDSDSVVSVNSHMGWLPVVVLFCSSRICNACSVVLVFPADLEFAYFDGVFSLPLHPGLQLERRKSVHCSGTAGEYRDWFRQVRNVIVI